MPITFKVITEDSKLVKSLQERVKATEKELADLKRQFNDVNFQLICEMQLNMELTDLLRDNGIKFRQSMDRRKRR